MFKQLFKQHFPIMLFRQSIFTSKTYIHTVVRILPALMVTFKSLKPLFTCTKIFRNLLRKFNVFIYSFSYKKNSYMWLPQRNMYLRAYEHSHALKKNCLQTLFARNRSYDIKEKNLLSLLVIRSTNNVQHL